MALTKEDLQAIGALLEPIQSDIKEVKQRVDDVAQRVDDVAQRVDDIEHSHKAIRADIATLNHEIIPKVNAMYDGITGINEKFDRLDRLEEKVERHGDRILALEYVIKAE